MKREIKAAYRDFLALDWAHRSYSDKDKVNHVREILHDRGIDVSDNDIGKVIRSTLYYRLMYWGYSLLGILAVAREILLPDKITEIFPTVFGISLVILIGATLAQHFHAYHNG